MNVFSIMYHDVVENGDWDSSGFSGDDAAVYKLDRAEFAKHLDSVRAAGVLVARADSELIDRSALLTFDDGGASAWLAAGMLEERGWRGHFFVTTDRIGTPGFLSPDQIRQLHRRGHIVGSHSCSHPTRMSQCSAAELDREWRESVRVLEEILGEPALIASVPGGYYSREVGEAAAAAGIRVLFNSEPTAGVSRVAGCTLLGRYYVQRGMPAQISGDFAAGRRQPRWKQAAVWQLKKALKTAGGNTYLRLREKLLKN